MKITIKILIIVLAFGLFTGPVFSNPCEESIKALNHSLENAPDEMTLEYLNAAVELCTQTQPLYTDAARYYKNWYKKEINPEKQLLYRQQAIEFYEKAIQAPGKENASLRNEMTELRNSRAFSKIAFRALRPSTPGAVNSGLDMHINFARNSFQLSDNLSIIDALGQIMKENKNVTISLEGHTDKTGALEYNDALSVNRAVTVKQYIVEKYTIDPSRMQVAGYGYKYLLDKNNPDGRLNRRVEVIKLTH